MNSEVIRQQTKTIQDPKFLHVSLQEHNVDLNAALQNEENKEAIVNFIADHNDKETPANFKDLANKLPKQKKLIDPNEKTLSDQEKETHLSKCISKATKKSLHNEENKAVKA